MAAGELCRVEGACKPRWFLSARWFVSLSRAPQERMAIPVGCRERGHRSSTSRRWSSLWGEFHRRAWSPITASGSRQSLGPSGSRSSRAVHLSTAPSLFLVFFLEERRSAVVVGPVSCGDKSRLGWSSAERGCGEPRVVIGGWADRVVDNFCSPPVGPQLSPAVHTSIPSCGASCTQPVLIPAECGHLRRSGCGHKCGHPVVNPGSSVGRIGNSCAQVVGDLGKTAGHNWG
jgi:hypothetical protein